MPQDNDAAGLAAKRHDLGELALEHLDSLFATARRLTRDRTAAEDLVQETFLKAIRSADRFEAGTNLRAWLFTILHNTFRNVRRDAGRDPVEVDSEVVDATADAHRYEPSPEQVLVDQATAAQLQACLDELPAAYRQAVWLRDVEDFSYAEIATILGVPIGTVMSRIARGRRLLYERLKYQISPARTGSSAADGRTRG